MFLQVLHLEEYECDDNRDCDVRYHSATTSQNKPNPRALSNLQAFLMHQNLPLISETFYYAVIGGDHPGVTVIRQVLSSHVLSSNCSLSPFPLQSIPSRWKKTTIVRE